MRLYNSKSSQWDAFNPLRREAFVNLTSAAFWRKHAGLLNDSQLRRSYIDQAERCVRTARGFNLQGAARCLP